MSASIIFASAQSVYATDSSSVIDDSDPYCTVETVTSPVARQPRGANTTYQAVTTRTFKSLIFITVAKHIAASYWTTNGTSVIAPNWLDTNYWALPPNSCTSTSNRWISYGGSSGISQHKAFFHWGVNTSFGSAGGNYTSTINHTVRANGTSSYSIP